MKNRRTIKLSLGVLAVMFALMAQQPTCNHCSAAYVNKNEVDAYISRAVAAKLVDQQARAVDIGKAHIGIGVVHRGKLDQPAKNSVAEHDLVSEVYHIID